MIEFADSHRRWASALGMSVLVNLLLFAFMAWLHYMARPYDNIPAIQIKFLPLSRDVQLGAPARPSTRAKSLPAPAAESRPHPDTHSRHEPSPETPMDSESAIRQSVQPLHRLTRLPQFLRRIEPAFPESERAAGEEAMVLVEIVVDTRGRILAVTILKSGGDKFDQAVLQALDQSLFTPGYIEEEPVVVRLQIPFTFRLR